MQICGFGCLHPCVYDFSGRDPRFTTLVGHGKEMGFITRLMSAVLPGRRADQPLVDQATRNVLVSAAGNAAGDVYDLLMPAARTEEQAIVISWETGLFGVAAACHFFTARYAEQIPPLTLATDVAAAYRARYLKLSATAPGSDSAIRINQCFEAQSQHALATVLGALYMLRWPFGFGSLNGLWAWARQSQPARSSGSSTFLSSRLWVAKVEPMRPLGL